ncbi:hypothetical protein T08_3930 [Trichinella sp. T8]|nr:hypothetical protein T08_3930 [Trichinella sp. T8]
MWISLEGRGSRGLHVLTYNGVFQADLLLFFSHEHRDGARTTPPSFRTASGKEAGRPTVEVDGVPGVPSAQEMYLTECLQRLEDFFWPNGVQPSNYGVVVRYLLSDPVLCELYLCAASSTSTGELLRGAKERASFVELIKRIHPLRQRESQIIKQCAEEVAKLGRRACVSDRDLVALLTGGVVSREVHRAIRLRDPPTLPEAHKGAEEVSKASELGKTSNCSEWPYEPLGVLDASAAVAWTSTDVTPPATRLKMNGGEKSNGDHQPADRFRRLLACPSSASQQKKGADDGQSQTTNCYCPSISQWMLNAV